MRVSRNELSSLFKQALRGAGLRSYTSNSSFRDFSGAHELLLLAAQYELMDWQYLLKVLERIHCSNSSLKPVSAESEQLFSQKFDLAGESLGAVALALVEFAMGQAMEREISASLVQECQDRSLILPAQAQARALANKHGLAAIAFWPKVDQNGICHTQASRLRAGEHHPSLSQSTYVSRPNIKLGKQDLVLVIANSELKAQRYMDQYWPETQHKLKPIISAQQFSKRLEQSINQGIELPENCWGQLMELAVNTLVPSDQHSRKGAGA